MSSTKMSFEKEKEKEISSFLFLRDVATSSVSSTLLSTIVSIVLRKKKMEICSISIRLNLTNSQIFVTLVNPKNSNKLRN